MSPNLAQCVVLLWIRLFQALWCASDLLWSSVHITLACLHLFLYAMTRFFEKDDFPDPLCRVVLNKKAVWGVVKSSEFEGNLRCSKILRISRKNPMMNWIVSISRDYWVYLDITWKSSKISEFWGEFWGIETFYRSKFGPATGVTPGVSFSDKLKQICQRSPTTRQICLFTGNFEFDNMCLILGLP